MKPQSRHTTVKFKMYVVLFQTFHSVAQNARTQKYENAIDNSSETGVKL